MMKIQQSKILSGLCKLTLPAVVLMWTSCANEEPAVADEESYTIRIQLATGGNFTRATWGDPGYDDWFDGSSFDRTISSVDLFLLDDNNLLTPLYALEKPSGGDITYECQVTGKTPGVNIDSETGVATLDSRIMAVVNLDGGASPWLSQQNWVNNKMPFEIMLGESESWHIPMWGVQTFRNVSIRPNETKTLAPIPLLRAVAKIVIKLDDSIKNDFDIVSVRMTEDSQRFKKAGFNLPADPSAVASTTDLSRDDCMELRADGEELRVLPDHKDSEGRWFTYVSESRLSNNSRPFAFNVTLRRKNSNEPSFSGVLYLSYYQPNNPAVPTSPIRSIVRNHVYEYTLRLAEMAFLPAVKVWEFGANVHIELE